MLSDVVDILQKSGQFQSLKLFIIALLTMSRWTLGSVVCELTFENISFKPLGRFPKVFHYEKNDLQISI